MHCVHNFFKILYDKCNFKHFSLSVLKYNVGYLGLCVCLSFSGRQLMFEFLETFTVSSIDNNVDPDQLASDEASCSGSNLFFIHTMISY